MAKANNLKGERFGKLTAIEPVGKSSDRQIVWLCRCDCGNEVKVPAGSLRKGNTKSCGCMSHRSIGGIGSGLVRRDDISGQRFGRLVALIPFGKTKHRGTIWKCKCDCGSVVNVERAHLISGATKSCGCIRNNEHHDESDNRLYAVWAGMKSRCGNKNHASYRFYGARGVKVCEEWSRSFLLFRDWAIRSGYDKTAKRGACTLDRIDPFGDYEPSNCRWISITEQQSNKRCAVSR